MKMLHNLLLVVLLAASVSASAQTCRSETEIPSSTPASQFTDHGDGTVTDQRTGLMWAKCMEGLSGADCATGSAWTGNWQQALDRAATSTLAGHNDWRLPNVKELISIVEERCDSPSINLAVFPGTPSVDVWSASPSAGSSTVAWTVVFDLGITAGYVRSYSLVMRLVRDASAP